MTAIPKPAKREKKTAKPVKKRNVKRQRRLFEENFGGAEYLAFIKSLPCDICGVSGFTEAAHLTSRGAGGKAEDIAPLCKMHSAFIGCHGRYDRHEPPIRKHEERLRKTAAARWLAYTQQETRVTDREDALPEMSAQMDRPPCPICAFPLDGVLILASEPRVFAGFYCHQCFESFAIVPQREVK